MSCDPREDGVTGDLRDDGVTRDLCEDGVTGEGVREVLEDKYGRKHNYLRVSLSERCNLRCKFV